MRKKKKDFDLELEDYIDEDYDENFYSVNIIIFLKLMMIFQMTVKYMTVIIQMTMKRTKTIIKNVRIVHYISF